LLDREYAIVFHCCHEAVFCRFAERQIYRWLAAALLSDENRTGFVALTSTLENGLNVAPKRLI
jgi:hypothetical protein